VPDEVRNPWIASLDEDGYGLFQTSTSRLRGRKLFRWGIQTGGQNWQRYLGSPDYVEIQAGLARTQSHHLPMPGGATWSWIEAYGAIHADGSAVHSSDWSAARGAVGKAVSAVAPGDVLETMLEESGDWASVAAKSEDVFLEGTGWGALETMRRRAAGVAGLGVAGIVFPESSLGVDQMIWKALHEGGVMPEGDIEDEPGAFASSAEWLEPLLRSLDLPGGRHWQSLFHAGVMMWEAGRMDEAAHAWEESCAARENAWARRCLGMAAIARGDAEAGVEHLRRAHRAKPSLRPLAVETLSALIDGKRAQEALDFIAGLPPQLKDDARIRLLQARACLGVDDLEGAQRILDAAAIPVDMHEGEAALCDVWFELEARRAAGRDGRELDDALRAEIRRTMTPPEHIDYRMGG